MFQKDIGSKEINEKLKSIANIQRQILNKIAAKSEFFPQKCGNSSSKQHQQNNTRRQWKENSIKTVIKSKPKHKHKSNKIKSSVGKYSGNNTTITIKHHGGLSDQIEQIRNQFLNQNQKLKGYMHDFELKQAQQNSNSNRKKCKLTLNQLIKSQIKIINKLNQDNRISCA